MTTAETKKTSAAPRMTSSHVKAALRMHYAAPQYATMEEVRNATGRLKKRQGKQPRYADMIAMGLWPSGGLEMIGFEVKVSRSDWLKEISDEKKSVPVSQFCDRWYLVTSSEKIVKEGESPDGWGWFVVDSDYRIREITPAPKRNAEPITREFLASLLRNATTSNPDYVEVQSKIIEEKSLSKPTGKSRSAAKTEHRNAKSVMAIGKRHATRVAMDRFVRQAPSAAA